MTKIQQLSEEPKFMEKLLLKLHSAVARVSGLTYALLNSETVWVRDLGLFGRYSVLDFPAEGVPGSCICPITFLVTSQFARFHDVIYFAHFFTSDDRLD